MKYICCFFFLVFIFSVQCFGQEGSKPVWLSWSKEDIELLNKVEGVIREGFYDESISMCEKVIRSKKSSKALISSLKLKQAKCYYITTAPKSSRNKIREAASIAAALTSEEEKEALKFEFISYFCFTKELAKADSVYGLLSSTSEGQYDFERKYYSSLLHSLKGDFIEIFNVINDPLLSSGESIAFTTLTAENKATFTQRRTSLTLIKAMSYSGYGHYLNADSILKGLSFSEELPQAWYYKCQADFLRGQNFQIQKKYNSAADSYLKVIATKELNAYSFDYLNAMYFLIESQLRNGNTTDAANYLRRLQMLAMQSSGKKEMVEVVFESANALSFLLKGEYAKAEHHLSLADANLKGYAGGHPLRLRIKELYKEVYSKSGKIGELNELALRYSLDVGLYSGYTSLVYHKARLDEARILAVYVGEPFTAVAIYKQHYDAGYSKLVFKNSPEHLSYLYAYADAARKIDALDTSARKMSRAVFITEFNFGKEAPEYIYAEARYAYALFNNGNYPLAVSMLKTLNATYSKIAGGSLALQEDFYMVMSELNLVPGDYELSRKFLSKALSVQQKRSTPDILIQAELEEKAASLYLRTNNFYKAERSLNRALVLKNKRIPAGNLLFYNVNDLFSSLKITTGDLASVENYLNAANAIALNVFGSNSLTSVNSKIQYGNYYLVIGDYKKAEMLFAEADKIVLGILGDKHLKHAELLLKLIISRSKLAGYSTKDIEKLYTQAVQIVLLDLGKENPLYMDIILKKASFFVKNKKFKEAEDLLAEAEKYWKGLLGNENKQIAEIELLKGDIMYERNNYVWAIEFYSSARKIYQSLFDENNIDYANASSKLAKVYYMNQDLDKSIAIMDDVIPKYLDFTVKYFPSMSFSQKQKYWNSIKDEFEFYNTLALKSSKNSTEMWGKAYNNTLATKAILLSSGMKILNQVMSSQDTILISLYHDWIGKKEYLLTILSLSKQQLIEQEIDRGKIEEDISRIEKEMSLRSSAFSKEDKGKKLTTWENVKEVLIDGEYAVEIVRYRNFDKVFTDSIYYAAFVIHRGSSSPALVLNNNGINMERRNLKYFRNVTTTNVDDEYSYDVYWKSIKSKIPDGSVVYISGDGVYNQLNIEMLRHDEGVYAIDENRFVFVSNTKDLLQMVNSDTKKLKDTKKENSVDYLLCGSPDFYSPDTKIVTKKIPALPGTEKEIQLVNDLLVANGKKTSVCVNAFLTEDTLKGIKNPKVIHVATHGYFKESLASEEDDLANSPLLNSGILLYASGDILDNQENKYVNQKSGVLTAYEAMNLTLDNTELVVLSACETGRGEVQVGEGVAGLQRSFLLAGSKSIVVSLFKVNDEVTQKLMLLFYEGWLKTGDKRTAFSTAKLKIKEEYKSPIYWGAFMMIEGRPDRTLTIVK